MLVPLFDCFLFSSSPLCCWFDFVVWFHLDWPIWLCWLSLSLLLFDYFSLLISFVWLFLHADFFCLLPPDNSFVLILFDCFSLCWHLLFDLVLLYADLILLPNGFSYVWKFLSDDFSLVCFRPSLCSSILVALLSIDWFFCLLVWFFFLIVWILFGLAWSCSNGSVSDALDSILD
jgi:hypothetical protein